MIFAYKEVWANIYYPEDRVPVMEMMEFCCDKMKRMAARDQVALFKRGDEVRIRLVFKEYTDEPLCFCPYCGDGVTTKKVANTMLVSMRTMVEKFIGVEKEYDEKELLMSNVWFKEERRDCPVCGGCLTSNESSYDPMYGCKRCHPEAFKC